MGPMPAIASASNPRIREIARSLETRTHFLLEGEKAILDAVAAGMRLDHVLHDESVRPGRLAAISAADPRLVSRAVLERLADSKTPQHLLAVARRRDVPVAEILSRDGPVVFVFGIQDPGNLGAIVRVAEAAGAAGVLGRAGNRRLLPSPRGARQRRQRAAHSGLGARVLRALRGRREGRGPGRLRCGRRRRRERVRGAAAPRRRVLAVGAEGTGLPAGAYRYLDRRLTIPMRAPGRVAQRRRRGGAAALLPGAAARDRLSGPLRSTPFASEPGSRLRGRAGLRAATTVFWRFPIALHSEKHLRPEGPRRAPRDRLHASGAEPGLAGDLGQKPLPVEAPLRRHLGQEQTASAAAARGSDRPDRSRDPRASRAARAPSAPRSRSRSPASSSARQRREARVLERGPQRVLRDHPSQVAGRRERPDATAKLAARVGASRRARAAPRTSRRDPRPGAAAARRESALPACRAPGASRSARAASESVAGSVTRPCPAASPAEQRRGRPGTRASPRRRSSSRPSKKWSASGITTIWRGAAAGNRASSSGGPKVSRSPTTKSDGTSGRGSIRPDSVATGRPSPTNAATRGSPSEAFSAIAAPNENPPATSGRPARASRLVQRGAHVVDLPAPRVVTALREPDAAKLEPQGREAGLNQGLDGAVDDLVVHRAAVERVRMREDRTSAARTRRRPSRDPPDHRRSPRNSRDWSRLPSASLLGLAIFRFSSYPSGRLAHPTTRPHRGRAR